MMIPCRVWVADMTSRFLGDGDEQRGFIVAFEGSTAVVVFEGSGLLGRIPLADVVVDIPAMHEQGLTRPWPPARTPGKASKPSERPPKRSEHG